MSSSSKVTPSACERSIAFVFVRSLVANPGIVNARMSLRGRPSRSIAFAATMSAWVLSSPPLTPMTIFGCHVSVAIARSRCSSPATWIVYAS